MTRHALAHVGSYAVIIAGLMLPAASYAANSNSPYNDSGANPAKSNCDSKTGCANYSTGDRTRVKPGHVSARSSRAEENAVTAKLNQQQLAGGK